MPSPSHSQFFHFMSLIRILYNIKQRAAQRVGKWKLTLTESFSFDFTESFEYLDNKIKELEKICENELKEQGFEE